MAQHSFGGPWTQIKLEVLRKYLTFYSQALKNKPFHKLYIDGFAGSGECTTSQNGQAVTLDGSAKIALNIDPPFDRVILIENDKRRFEALQKLSSTNDRCDVRTFNTEANGAIKKICRGINWKANRAVMFLDPYGLEVEWKTLEEIAKTKAVDVWLLFSVSGLFRQASRKFGKVDEHKAAAIDKCLGTTEWRKAFYSEPKQGVLFGDPEHERHAGWEDMLNYFKDRLSTIFGYVERPLILKNKNIPYFALFLAVANDNPKAIALSRKAGKHILERAK